MPSLAHELTAEGRYTAALVPMEVSAAFPSDIGAALTAWTEASARPLIVFLDEVDVLRNGVLVSVLRQLRDGYGNRPEHFPTSLALIGLRDVRDYKAASGDKDILGTAGQPRRAPARAAHPRHPRAHARRLHPRAPPIG